MVIDVKYVQKNPSIIVFFYTLISLFPLLVTVQWLFLHSGVCMRRLRIGATAIVTRTYSHCTQAINCIQVVCIDDSSTVQNMITPSRGGPFSKCQRTHYSVSQNCSLVQTRRDGGEKESSPCEWRRLFFLLCVSALGACGAAPSAAADEWSVRWIVNVQQQHNREAAINSTSHT